MVHGIDHTAICARNSNLLADWYVKTFGAKIVYDNGEGGYFVAFENGDMVEIFRAEGANTEFEEKTEGIRHIALSVDKDNFDSVVAVLKADDYVKEVRDVWEDEKGIKTYWFLDIEGNFMHLTYRPTPLA